MQPAIQKTILIVEDTADIRRVVTLILSNLGYEVESVPNGEHCVDAARRFHPDLVLMDLSMPLMDGWEATRQLKADPATAHIPVLAFTAHVQEKELARARAAGCVNVITKPFDIDNLLDEIANALVQAAPQAALRRRSLAHNRVIQACRGGLRGRIVAKDQPVPHRSSVRTALLPAARS